MVKNRGETLIESLISMFFITVAIIPIANLFLKTFQTDVKVDDLNKKNVNIENMIEIIKAKKYEEILNFNGKCEISEVDDFYNRFAVEKKYQILKNIDFTKINIFVSEPSYTDEYPSSLLALNMNEDTYYFDLIFTYDSQNKKWLIFDLKERG